MEGKYKSIIDLPHHTSHSRSKMTAQDRAAQFAPYAALVGFGDVVAETARVTEERAIQDEGEIEKINRALTYILAHGGRIKATFTYFVKDERKGGGRYERKVGFAAEIDEIKRVVIFNDKTFLPIDDIVSIELI